MNHRLTAFLLLLSAPAAGAFQEPVGQDKVPPSPAATAGENEPVARNPELRAELLRRVELDQQARGELVAWMSRNRHGGGSKVDADPPAKETQPTFAAIAARVQKMDRENTAWLQEVIQTHGWPTHSLVGVDGANAAWLLVQHADADTAFQRRCLDLMRKLPEDEVSAKNVAYLTDRVLLAEGKKQIYGTQCTLADGKWTPRPLEDAANVDARRAKVGLPPLAEYLKLVEQMYQGQSQGKSDSGDRPGP